MKTPFYFYDLTLLDKTLSALVRSAERHDVAVHYALKANNHPRILRTIAAAGFGADCVSGGEIEAAIEAGFPASDIFFAGVGKSDEEILLALEARIGAFVVESAPELLNIERLAASKNSIAPILLRLNPEVDAHTHSHITTGLAENKFGLLPEDALALMPHILQSGSLAWRGLHFHIGSQIRSAEVFEELCEKTNRILASFRTVGYFPDIIDMGGGLGINYDEPEAEPIPDFAAYIERYRRMIETGEARLHIEPGRSVVAQCGSLITQVLYIKEGKAKKFAIVDAGMTDLVRPALYEAHHQIRLVQPGEWAMCATYPSTALTEKYDVVGPICESSDVFERELLMSELKRGDYLAIRSAGAYGAVMASSYNMRPLPGCLFSDEQYESTSHLKAWLALLRPHTLPASVSPVVVAIAYAIADGHFRWAQAVLALIVAVSAQTVSNIANDWFDYKKGADTDQRVGFDRGISKGWLSERQVLAALFSFLFLLGLGGLLLCAISNWWLLLVGVVVAIGALSYSAGPYPLAYHGLGEVAVFIFFGLIPVLFTYYVLAGNFPADLWHLGAAMGFAGVNILIVNNYRDYEEDRKSGKRTILVKKGRDLGPKLYLACGLLSMMVLYPFFSAGGLLLLMLYLSFFMTNYRRLLREEGAALNALLVRTAKALSLLALVTIAMLFLAR